MPAAFDRCVANGGKVRTIRLPGNRYRHICIINGKVYRGYIKRKQIKTGKGKGN